MDEDTKREFKAAVEAGTNEAVGSLLIAEVRLPFSRANGAKRGRTNAEVGVEVCALIELTRGWTPTKGVGKNDVVRDAKGIAATVKQAILKIKDYNRRYGEGPAFLTSGQSMSEEEILDALQIIQARFASEVVDYAQSLDKSQMLPLGGFIKGIVKPEYKKLFVTKKGRLGLTANNYPEKGPKHDGALVRFMRVIFDAADKQVSDSTLYDYAITKGKRSKKIL